MNGHDEPTPWYRQFWPWFLIMLPGAAVVGSVATVFVAFATRDSFVVDDYSRIDEITARVQQQDRVAQALGLRAEIKIETGNIVTLRLERDAPGSVLAWPTELELELAHPAIARRDQTIRLARINGGGGADYRGALTTAIEDRHYLELTDAATAISGWRLAGELGKAATRAYLTPPRIAEGRNDD